MRKPKILLLGVGMLVFISLGAFAQQTLNQEEMDHPETGVEGVWMDSETYNWYYGGVEYAFICDDALVKCQAFVEQQLLPALEEAETLRYEAEAVAERRGKILRWALPTSAGLGLLLGITGGMLLGN